MTTSYEPNHYPYYPEACEVVVPITLKVPIFLQPEVIGKPPVCHSQNGHKPVSQAQEQDQKAPT